MTTKVQRKMRRTCALLPEASSVRSGTLSSVPVEHLATSSGTAFFFVQAKVGS
jgi:hypothetical protein